MQKRKAFNLDKTRREFSQQTQKNGSAKPERKRERERETKRERE